MKAIICSFVGFLAGLAMGQWVEGASDTVDQRGAMFIIGLMGGAVGLLAGFILSERDY